MGRRLNEAEVARHESHKFPIVLVLVRADVEEARHEYGIEISSTLPAGPFDAAVLAVRHDEIMALGPERIRALLSPGGLVYDVKGVLPPGQSDACL